MFNRAETKKDSFLEMRKAARSERANERAYEESKQKSILILQRNIRGWLCRLQFKRKILQVSNILNLVYQKFTVLCFRSDFDTLFPADGPKEPELKPCLDVYHCACRFLLQWKSDKENELHKERLERLCRYLLASLASDSPKLSYIGVALNKEYSLFWIRHIKKLLYKCCVIIETLKPESHSDSISLALYLHTLVALTSPNTWTILRNKNLAGLKAGMTNLCSNILGDLIQRGFFLTLRVRENNIILAYYYSSLLKNVFPHFRASS
jgi:ubiquitin-protein ligase E3 B